MYSPNPGTKVVAGMAIITVLVVGATAFFEAVDPGEVRPIQVRYEDGMSPVDATYTRVIDLGEPTYHNIVVLCPDVKVTVKVGTYTGAEPTDKVKEELQVIICEPLEEK